MGGRRVRIMVGVIVAVLALGAGTASAAKIFFSASHGQRSLGFTLNTDKGKIVGFAWSNLRCSDGRVSGGLKNAVKVNSDRSFKSEQKVTTVEGLKIDVLLKGTVNRDQSQVSGKLKFSGDCESKGSFTAVPQG